jgi:hypothetical protein
VGNSQNARYYQKEKQQPHKRGSRHSTIRGFGGGAAGAPGAMAMVGSARAKSIELNEGNIFCASVASILSSR